MTPWTRREPVVENLQTRIAPAFVSGTFPLAGLSGGDGSAFHGGNPGDYSGSAVSAAGDVNGDGFGDFIIGASQVSPGPGAAYVIFGTAAGFPQDVTLNANFLDGTKGFQLLGEAAGDQAGYSVGAAGDVNGDGFDDLLIGFPQNGTGLQRGGAYVVFGRADIAAAPPTPVALNGSDGFRLIGEEDQAQAGVAVSGAGDLNGDGFDDLVMGTLRA